MSRFDDRKWLGINVNRDRKHEPLVERLTQGEHVIFQHNKDLMVFAARYICQYATRHVHLPTSIARKKRRGLPKV